MDTSRLKESFARVAMHGDEVALFFYSDLFLRHPETRNMFPISMAEQRGQELSKLGAEHPWLTVIPCVSDDPDYCGERGALPDLVARSGSWAGHEAYIAGPTPMVEAMGERLSSLGGPAGQVHVEDFGWSEPCP